MNNSFVRLAGVAVAALLWCAPGAVMADVGDTPSQVVNKFYTQLKALDGGTDDKILSSPLLSEDFAQLVKDVSQQDVPYFLDFDPWVGGQQGFSDFAIIADKSEGDFAQVDIMSKYPGMSDRKVKVFLKKYGQEWKIANIVIPEDGVDVKKVLTATRQDYLQHK